MLRNKKKALAALLLCAVMSTCAAAPAKENTDETPAEETNTGLTIQNESNGNRYAEVYHGAQR